MNDVLMRAKRITALAVAIIVGASAVAYSLLSTPTAHAAELTDRRAVISTSEVSQTDVELHFYYNLPNTTATKAGIIYEFCTTPQDAANAFGSANCTAPGWTLTGATHDSQSAWPNNGTAFTVQAGDLGACTETSASTKVICFDRDEAVANLVTGGAVEHTISGINTNSTEQTVYIRIAIYSDDDYGAGDILDTGSVAVALVDQLTVSGRVAERLVFCVFAYEDADGRPDNCADSEANESTAVDIGIIDSSTIATSPVDNSPPTAIGNDRFGALMVNTNAGDGVSVTYFVDPATNVSGGDADQLAAFRVLPTNCSATETDETDQCFESALNAGESFTGGDERFGAYVACIENNDGTLSVTDNLINVPAAYTGTDADVQTGPTTCENEAANTKFAWNDLTTPLEIANSTASTVKVVDDEIVKLRFGATAAPTTPTGTYTVVTTYIATPQF